MRIPIAAQWMHRHSNNGVYHERNGGMCDIGVSVCAIQV